MKGDAGRLPESDYTAGVCPRATRMKHFIPVLLATMAIIAGIAGSVSKADHWGAAIFFYSVCGVLGLSALVAGYIESIPKPHIVPVGYGAVGEAYSKLLAAGAGLLFENDGEPAYRVTPPNPTRFGTIGDPTLVFDDPGIARLTKEDGRRCFPVTIKDSFGERTGDPADLRQQIGLSGAKFVLVSFQYADSKKPRSLRYRTICKIEPHATGLKVSLVDCKFDWLRLFWGRE